jgi:hypothetical protein
MNHQTSHPDEVLLALVIELIILVIIKPSFLLLLDPAQSRSLARRQLVAHQ